MATAKEVVHEELERWLQSSEISALTQIQALELQVKIWEYGKWCALTGDQLGYKSQLNFRGSRPESTAWDAIAEIGDDEAMRIAQATRQLSSIELRVITDIYQRWIPVERVRASLRVGMRALDAHRLSALETIAEALSKKTKAIC